MYIAIGTKVIMEHLNDWFKYTFVHEHIHNVTFKLYTFKIIFA